MVGYFQAKNFRTRVHKSISFDFKLDIFAIVSDHCSGRYRLQYEHLCLNLKEKCSVGKVWLRETFGSELITMLTSLRLEFVICVCVQVKTIAITLNLIDGLSTLLHSTQRW